MEEPIIPTFVIILIIGILIGVFISQEILTNKIQSNISLENTQEKKEIKWNDKGGVTEVNLKNVALASARFGINLLENLSESKKRNIIFSPLSIWLAMAMLYEGANGSTAEEIAKVMHFPENKSLLRENILWFLENFANHTENYTLEIANSLWAQEGFPIKEDYIRILQEYYYAYFQFLNFSTNPERARKIINTWIENETHGMIKDFFAPGEISPLTVAVLVNTLYFHGLWAHPFNETYTTQEYFYTPTQKIKVDMMHIYREFKYTEDEDAQVLEMPYRGGNLSMLVILPKNNNTLNLSIEMLERWRNNLCSMKVNVSLPKFKLDEKFSVKEALEAVGIKRVFEPIADLTDMGPGGLWASDVVHETKVIVNEEGTEAAAATGIPIPCAPPPPLPWVDFRANHPFLFLIQNRDTGAIFFMGWVEEPAQ
ncbi:MAG: serpin family protein [Thermoplasmata archaeon]|nr:serpin family protein [Thermoplasmata archaeon]